MTTGRRSKKRLLFGVLLFGMAGIIIWGYYALGFHLKPTPEEIKKEEIAQQALLRSIQTTASTSLHAEVDVSRSVNEHSAIQIAESDPEKTRVAPPSSFTSTVAPTASNGKSDYEDTPFAIETPDGMVRVKPGEYYFYPPTWHMGVNPTEEEGRELDALALELANPTIGPERKRAIQARRNQLFQQAMRPEMRVNGVIFHLGSRPEKLPNAWEEFHRRYPDGKYPK